MIEVFLPFNVLLLPDLRELLTNRRDDTCCCCIPLEGGQ